MKNSQLNGVGIGFKPEHFTPLLADAAPLRFLEIHAENYMGDGGLPHAQLRHLREMFQLSLHGVGLSIGGENPLDKAHLARLKKLITLYAPESFSEHLAWSSHEAYYYNDLLPIAYDEATLRRVCAHIDEVQTVLGQEMLLENPSTYLEFAHSAFEEVDFIREIAQRTGCGLLLDLNNVHISAHNHQKNAYDYLARFPLESVREIHLAGFVETQDDHAAPLLIDSHSTPVAGDVWGLYQFVLAKTGAIATLIEWDNDVPPFEELKAEAMKAYAYLEQTHVEQAHLEQAHA
jgi:uncharacterized protein